MKIESIRVKDIQGGKRHMQPTDIYGVPIGVGDAVHSTLLNQSCHVMDIVPPGPPLAVSGNPEEKPVSKPGVITLLFEVNVQYDHLHLAIQSLKKLAVQAPMDWMRIPKTNKQA